MVEGQFYVGLLILVFLLLLGWTKLVSAVIDGIVARISCARRTRDRN